MNLFNLPKSAEVKKVIPKNAFDSRTNSKQKKAFSEKVIRMTWSHKLSIETINLGGKEIAEIQIIDIELKEKVYIKDLLNIIDKAIPYHIIFFISHKDNYYISTSSKHIDPHNENNSVIDYTFSSEWSGLNKIETALKIELKNNLDWVYKKICEQFVQDNKSSKNIKELVAQQTDLDRRNREIERLKSAIAKSKQFNKKVELNMRLKELEKDSSEN